MDRDPLRLSWSLNLVDCLQSQLLLACLKNDYPMDPWDTPFEEKVKQLTELNSSSVQRG